MGMVERGVEDCDLGNERGEWGEREVGERGDEIG